MSLTVFTAKKSFFTATRNFISILPRRTLSIMQYGLPHEVPKELCYIGDSKRKKREASSAIADEVMEGSDHEEEDDDNELGRRSFVEIRLSFRTSFSKL